MPNALIAPSLLSADFARLGEEVRNGRFIAGTWARGDVEFVVGVVGVLLGRLTKLLETPGECNRAAFGAKFALYVTVMTGTAKSIRGFRWVSRLVSRV